MVVQVHEIVRATVAASRHIRASTEQMAHGAQQQIEQASQVASAAEQMTSAVADNARHIGVVAEMAQRSGQDAQEGGRVVRLAATHPEVGRRRPSSLSHLRRADGSGPLARPDGCSLHPADAGAAGDGHAAAGLADEVGVDAVGQVRE